MFSSLKPLDFILIIFVLFELSLILLSGEPGDDFVAVKRNAVISTDKEKDPEGNSQEIAPKTLATVFGSRAEPIKVISQPLPKIESKPIPVIADKNSLEFLGAMTSNEGERRYFFKVKNTGRPLTLVQGVEIQGWKLLEIQSGLFRIQGPGGIYEVIR